MQRESGITCKLLQGLVDRFGRAEREEREALSFQAIGQRRGWSAPASPGAAENRLLKNEIQI